MESTGLLKGVLCCVPLYKRNTAHNTAIRRLRPKDIPKCGVLEHQKNCGNSLLDGCAASNWLVSERAMGPVRLAVKCVDHSFFDEFTLTSNSG